MFLKHNKFAFLVLLLLGFAPVLRAQNEISMPYSSFGVGMLSTSSNGHLDGMGGVSYALQNPYRINFRNPASYAAFDSLSFVADAAASLYVSNIRQGNLTQKNTYAKALYLTIGLPVTAHWRTSVGIVPFSTLGYDIAEKQTLENVGGVSYNYTGKGGLNQLYWGNAFRICKGLSIGLNASYMFGSLNYSSNTAFDGSNFYNTYILHTYLIDGIYLSGGLQYLVKIKDNHTLGFGATYSNSAYIWAKEKTFINYYTGDYSTTTTYDTLLLDVRKGGRLVLPQAIGGGLSYTYKDKLTVAADVTWQNWAKYSLMGRSDSTKNAIVTSAGVQYTPNPQSTKFVQRMSFRLGAKYSTGIFMIRNKPVTELAVSLGVGFPLTTFNTHSSINIALEYGKTGTLDNNLIRQNYFRFTLNFTLQERWYQRLKMD